METMHGTLNLLLLQGPELWMREKFRPANFSLINGNNQKSLVVKLELYGGMGQNLDALLL